jgi:hypothetical protein
MDFHGYRNPFTIEVLQPCVQTKVSWLARELNGSSAQALLFILPNTH